MGTLHCALENGSDLNVNERQKRYDTIEEELEEECQIAIFFTWRGAYVKLRYYSVAIHSFDWKSAIEHDGGI